MIEERERIGFRLRCLRLAAGVKQGDAAQRIGVSQATVSQIETGSRDAPVSRVAALLALYGAPWAALDSAYELTARRTP